MRYLLITFFRQPGGAVNEQAGFSKKIRTADQQICNVILDYKDRKVLKCVIEGKKTDTTFEKMHEYYKQVYPTLIDQLEKNQLEKK